ncbi:hypothetical protein Fluta_3450 [Fluviicola taffensis DSM 16823]|uniref:Uncharacterized protein n=1 Tax=Fluviicola taffensis (strain DSM 16823 / NCIMB 13979 / RW262) TaxID=755732 RepID=F2ICF2_FLUTR|nr:hypothetical protein Fluta_3450 [Fluviicola taffensis DSM 16823]
MLMNFLKGIWDWTFYFGNEEWFFLIRFANYTGKFHFLIYGLIYILEIIFVLALNRFVKKHRIGRGYHLLIVLVSFLPLVNLFLFYILKRKLNKQLFTFSGMNSLRSDRKIVAIWILMILLVIYIFIIIPFLTFYVDIPELVSGAVYYSHISIVVTDCCFLTISLIWFFYYREFKRMLNVLDLNRSGIRNTQLLDN